MPRGRRPSGLYLGKTVPVGLLGLRGRRVAPSSLELSPNVTRGGRRRGSSAAEAAGAQASSSKTEERMVPVADPPP